MSDLPTTAGPGSTVRPPARMSRQGRLCLQRVDPRTADLDLSEFDGSRGHAGHEELTLRFLPRLNPLARALTLTFSHPGEQVALELQLP